MNNKLVKLAKARGWLVLCFLLLSLTENSEATLRLPKVVGDNMVVQRDASFHIWGWASSKENISISFAGQTKITVADSKGKWMITLDPIQAGGPFDMTIQGKEKLVLHNILVGEVWVCSGQSNMEWSLIQAINGPAAVVSSENANIRLFNVINNKSSSILDDVESDGWKSCNPSSSKDFSAIAYFFGKALNEKYKVPIGLIESDWGGSPAEVWTSSAMLKTLDNYKDVITAQEIMLSNRKSFEKKYAQEAKDWLAQVNKLDPGMTGNSLAAQTDASNNWESLNFPGLWETKTLPAFDGIVYCEKEVELPQSLQDKDLVLSLSLIDDVDDTWFNGHRVGGIDGYNKVRTYKVPRKYVNAGKNKIMVRIIDYGGGGGIYGNTDNMWIGLPQEKVSLSGSWKYKITAYNKDLPVHPTQPFESSWQMTSLFNAMIAPITNFTIKGAIWYQGEANAGAPEQYKKLFPAMISDWRNQWKQGDFPFLFVQLANFDNKTYGDGTFWPLIRESQRLTLDVVPNCGMAVAIDAGESATIHPRNKQLIGERLSLLAGKLAYHEDIVCNGPVYRGMQVESDTIRLVFNPNGTKLTTKKGESLHGFEIAGADKVFKEASAKISGETVLLWNTEVKNPIAVRYAWENDPKGCNLYNAEGLPASPFRTDDWE
jgi:sialate O-acetylesterase